MFKRGGVRCIAPLPTSRREPLGIAAFFLDPVGLDRLQTEGDESKRRPGRRPLDGSDAGPMAHVDTESARSADLRHKTGI